LSRHPEASPEQPGPWKILACNVQIAKNYPKWIFYIIGVSTHCMFSAQSPVFSAWVRP
jgi:hypothetical protein